jgi:hypothetical protein
VVSLFATLIFNIITGNREIGPILGFAFGIVSSALMLVLPLKLYLASLSLRIIVYLVFLSASFYMIFNDIIFSTEDLEILFIFIIFLTVSINWFIANFLLNLRFIAKKK